MAPIRFVFGLHLHQPVGNFDHVFQQHLDDVYAPLLERLAGADFLPIVLHVSGPLFDWLDAHAPAWMDRLGRLAVDGRVELLLAGFYEPVLASLPRRDRVEQIQWMREALRRRFGVDATGLWLTERVWEPELAADLADAGVRYALVDDRHFVVSGFPRERLHAPFWTEADTKRVALFPIDERLRYLIPFRPPEETASYLQSLAAAGHELAVLADDGEKFGGWPGTREWVYEQGWLDRFVHTIGELVARGRGPTQHAGRRRWPRCRAPGIAYLPTASYREMEAWSLPPEPALRLGPPGAGSRRGNGWPGPDGALVRGAHWRNFLAKYPESNRMHKKMQALSTLCRRRGDPPEARRAIGRAQCNDAYWHGVFGGLYLPHLREAIWRNLADAEARAARGPGPRVGGARSRRRRPRRDLGALRPLLRGREPVAGRRGRGPDPVRVRHQLRQRAHPTTRGLSRDGPPAGRRAATAAAAARASIHDIEAGMRLAEQPPVDADDRALFVDRVLPGDLSLDAYARGAYAPLRSWARSAGAFSDRRCRGRHRGAAQLSHGGRSAPEDRARGRRRPTRPSTTSGPPPRTRSTRSSRSSSRSSGRSPSPASPEPDRWTFPVETVAKSERGLDRTCQGESVTLRWPLPPGTGAPRARSPEP